MITRTIGTEQDRDLLIRLIKSLNLPVTVSITKGRRRTVEQNKLQRLWINEAAEQLGDRTREEMRGYCKLHHGVPILRNENDAFKEAYDQVISPLPYEDKLKTMMAPLDMPVTRIMTTDQKTRYLDAIAQGFLEQGVALTEPEGRKATA